MEFLHASFLGYALWLWLVFGGVVVTLLALDLGVLHREGGEISVTESLWLSAGYIAVAVAFATNFPSPSKHSMSSRSPTRIWRE